MSEVTSVNITGANLEILDLGFEDFTAFDIDLIRFYKGHYRNRRATQGSVCEVPQLKNLITRTD